MVVFLTFKCQLECRHCAYSCGPEAPGGFLSTRHFRRALEVAGLEKEGEIVLLGGEPLLHPRFFEFLVLALSTGKDVQLTTNGMYTERIMPLLALAERTKRLTVRLSRTKYHHAPHPIVDWAFNSCVDLYKAGKIAGKVSITKENQSVTAIGRGRQIADAIPWNQEAHWNGNSCWPDGSITPCSCPLDAHPREYQYVPRFKGGLLFGRVQGAS